MLFYVNNKRNGKMDLLHFFFLKSCCFFFQINAFFCSTHSWNFTHFCMQICQTRAWMLSTGFTLAYGAMFSKVWRVHRFTTKQKQDPKVCKNECFSMYVWVSVCLLLNFEWIEAVVEWVFFFGAAIFFFYPSRKIAFYFFFYIFFVHVEKSWTMEAVYNGIWIAVGRFSDTVNVAIHRSTSKAAWNISTGEAIIGNWWHSDKSRARALWKWKPIDLVRYVRMAYV